MKIKKFEESFQKYKSISEKLIKNQSDIIERQKRAIEILVSDLKNKDDNYKFSVVR